MPEKKLDRASILERTTLPRRGGLSRARRREADDGPWCPGGWFLEQWQDLGGIHNHVTGQNALQVHPSGRTVTDRFVDDKRVALVERTVREFSGEYEDDLVMPLALPREDVFDDAEPSQIGELGADLFLKFPTDRILGSFTGFNTTAQQTAVTAAAIGIDRKRQQHLVAAPDDANGFDANHADW
jgi:hypothetical protein